LNGGTSAAPATAEDTRKPALATPLVNEGRVCGRVVYTRVTEGPSIRAGKGDAETDEEGPKILFATPLRVTDAEYVEARLAEVTAVLLQVIDAANVPDVRPDTIRVKSVSEEGLTVTGPAVYVSKGEL
jgi:hypothetical protein